MILMYVLYIRTLIFRQPYQVWNISLTEDISHDLEGVQKGAWQIILGEHYSSYVSTYEYLNLSKIQMKPFMWKIAIKCNENEKTKHTYVQNKWGPD